MPKEINLLILSVGRRVELINLFKEAFVNLNVKGCVFAADASKLAPALYFADEHFILPSVSEDNYLDELIALINNKKVDLVIPTIDTELMILSENSNDITKQTNAKVLISNPEVIKICRNKIKTYNFLIENKFLTPRVYRLDEISATTKFPLFVKPISGSSSINAFKVNSLKELNLYVQLIDQLMIQDFLDGQEYSVDVFLDFLGNVISVVPRLRIKTRSGEILQGKIVKDKTIISEVKRLMECLQPIGHITVQLMKTSKGIEFIEINPRFGGGAPMSIKSGANSCENLIKLLNNEALTYNENYHEGQIHLRFDQSIIIGDDND